MTQAPLERYARLAALPGVGAAGVAALGRQPVAVIGLGNIGGQLAQHLVMLGGRVVLVDRDVVSGANLGTQGFTERHVGRPKAEARAEWLGPLNPACRIEPVHAEIRRLGLGALRDISLLFSCVDSRASRVVINEMAMRLGIPWIDGALDGSGRALFGRVACYHPPMTPSACYLCGHDAASLREISNEAGAAAGCPVRWWDGSSRSAVPTLAPSALGGAVAALQALWGLKVLLGDADEVAGREVYFDLGRQRLTRHRLMPNPRCLLEHRTWRLTPIGGSRTSVSVADTFAFAESALDGGVTLQLAGRSIVTSVRCPECRAERPINRAVDAIGHRDVLCGCGGEMHPAATDLLDRFSRLEAGPFLHHTWNDIGLPPADVVIAATGAEELPLLLPDL
jgi:molybdopterin/thiamine biosynthesis adenylyltransferase